ncbi:hypothetical protein LWI29_035810 [Acer saccharum]|uniref:Glycosyltransferase N-terminal domain-containing protein n=1 Tax=Acer saccharum TaxID=4024 RepID=A0AA39TBY2_ACESA|nr:hypothetical protein LWI29_035810 [Acer saccharum]KAK1589362.1 hypothetical protein Q3G72_033216 [Acer saccharum]
MGSLNKPHAVLVPYPAQGHINPLMQLAKLLHLRGFYITFVNTEFNHRRLIRSKGLNYVRGQPDFRFETIPDGLPLSDIDATQDLWTLSDSVQRNCLSPFRQVLAKLSSCSECPPVTCIISDGLMTFTMKAAEELGIQEVQFYTTSACGFMAYLCFGGLINRGLVPFKDENFMINGSMETPIDWIPGMRNFRLKDFPTPIRTADPNDIMLNFMKEETQNCLNSSAIILNTFDEFEHEILQAIAAKFPRNIYTIGPLSLLETGITTGSCQYSCTVWGIGMEVNHVVKCDEVEALIKEMMEEDKGKQMKKNALEWKKKAQAATSIGGSSYHNFNRFIKDVLYGCK